MTSNKHKIDKKEHKQQVLFAENELPDEQPTQVFEVSKEGKQVIFDNNDYLPLMSKQNYLLCCKSKYKQIA